MSDLEPVVRPRLWWFAADSIGDLQAQLDQHESEIIDTTRPGVEGFRPPQGGPVRLAMVDPDARKLALARRLLASGEAWRGRSDIWFTTEGLATAGGRVAFLFPGVEPTFGADRTNLPALGEVFGIEPPEVDESSLTRRSRALVLLGVYLADVLRRLDVAPDLYAGHSLGEWSAAVDSGMWTRDDVARVLELLDVDQLELPDVDFAALGCGADRAMAVVGHLEGIELSHDNCSRQSVICGPPAVVSHALDLLRAENLIGYKLDFQSGFHTSALDVHLPFIGKVMDLFEMRSPEVPMWSATIADRYPDDPAAIEALHLRHLVQTVRFRELIERLYEDEGVRVFVQPGIGSLLGFVNDTLGDRAHASVDVLVAKRSALSQLHRTLSALWIEGVAFDGSLLFGREASPVEVRSEAPVLAAPSGLGPDALRMATELLLNATQANRQVLDAWTAKASGLTPASVVPVSAGPIFAPTPIPVAQIPAAPASAVPPPASPPAPSWPTGIVKIVRHLSLANRPETLDHRLYRLPEGWPDSSDGFPIIAMTTQLEILAEVAREYGGGREVVELSNVRNFTWFDLSNPVDLEITIAPIDDDTLKISLGRFCRANVRMGTFAAPARYEAAPLKNPRPAKHDGAAMFTERIMFHGPSYQGITTMGPVGDDGMYGEIENLPTPGALLDDVGKLIAYWVLDRQSWHEAPLPLGVERVEFFGPPLPAGSLVHCDVRIQSHDTDQVKADATLVAPNGDVWCEVEGWMSHIFHLDDVMYAVTRFPERNVAAEVEPGGWLLVPERWPTGAGRDLTSRGYLRRDEREHYDSLNLLQQRHFLIERVAAKEAVRHLVHAADRDCYPAEIYVEATGDGRYAVLAHHLGDRPTHVAVRHIEWIAVALWGDDPDLDIEIQPILPDDDADEVAAGAVAALQARRPTAEVRHAIRRIDHMDWADLDAIAVAWTGGGFTDGPA